MNLVVGEKKKIHTHARISHPLVSQHGIPALEFCFVQTNWRVVLAALLDTVLGCGCDSCTPLVPQQCHLPMTVPHV